jgi:hypothetical protein
VARSRAVLVLVDGCVLVFAGLSALGVLGYPPGPASWWTVLAAWLPAALA